MEDLEESVVCEKYNKMKYACISICVWVCFWTFYSVLLIQLGICVPVLHFLMTGPSYCVVIDDRASPALLFLDILCARGSVYWACVKFVNLERIDIFLALSCPSKGKGHFSVCWIRCLVFQECLMFSLYKFWIFLAKLF